MPNQEDYLDNLLKEVTDELDTSEFIDLDNLDLNDRDSLLHSLGEEDMDKLLSESREAAEDKDVSVGVGQTSDEDVLMSLLQDSDEDDLQEIHNLLTKSDNNESLVDKGMEEEDPAAAILAEIENGGSSASDKDKAAEEAKRLREAKQEEKRLAREAKKAEAEAKKAAKKAEAEAKRAAKKAEAEAKKAAKKAEAEAKKAAKKTAVEAKGDTSNKPAVQENFDDMDALLNAAGEGNAAMENEMFSEPSLFAGVESDDNSLMEDISSLEGVSSKASLMENISTENISMEDTSLDDDADALLNELSSSMAFDGDITLGGNITVEENSAEDGAESAESTDDLMESLEQLQGDKEPKKGFFGKLLDFFMEEDEDEEEEAKGNEDIQLSGENQAILEEMDKEKGKKKKAKKGKKGKKGKDAEAGAEAEGDEESEENGKGKKAKKAKKPKKEKAPQPEEPGKKLSKKRVFLIVLVCATFTAVILILTNICSEYSIKRNGRKAYYDGDYQTCYQDLYGKRLNESEKVMYNKSECILKIRLWMREYELFASEGDEVKALDNLIQSINSYPELYDFASQWNSTNEVAEVYNRMTAILSDKYHLSVEQALAIAAEPDDIEYTKQVTAAAQGGTPDFSQGTEDNQKDEPLKDVLPEEEGLDNSGFIDNNP